MYFIINFYLYDSNGNLKRQVTNGSFHVDSFRGIDEKNRQVYFVANGIVKEKPNNKQYEQ